jgi:Domain of unknown function (DUF3883)
MMQRLGTRMIDEHGKMTTREKLILAGLYFAKYDSIGLEELGFESFGEAFNVIGYALASKPAAVKNYRDEFDPLFPNPRKGWHKRQTRKYCLDVLERYNSFDFQYFTGLVKSFFGYDPATLEETAKADDPASSFAQRLITGLAAERYFESIQADLPEFTGYLREDTTRFGCGYDYRLQVNNGLDFLAVEVKGLHRMTGTLSLTPKEYEVAAVLKERFFLFVVKNFRESPCHQIFQNPLSENLRFRRTERITVQVSWLTTI